ncbi:MAG: transcription termination/antitermination NusG family protein [Xanthobacteraceae bacterium]
MTWYVIITEPTRELSATANLVARRYDAFCPSVYRMRPVKRSGVALKDDKGRRILKKITSPMFVGYIFIPERSAVGRFDKIEQIAGVRRFMRIGEGFATLPDALMQAIRNEEERQMAAFEESAKAKSELAIPFAEGGPARIEGGPYDDFVGKMVRLNKNGRLQMLLNLFGRETKVVVDASQVRAA